MVTQINLAAENKGYKIADLHHQTSCWYHPKHALERQTAAVAEAFQKLRPGDDAQRANDDRNSDIEHGTVEQQQRVDEQKQHDKEHRRQLEHQIADLNRIRLGYRTRGEGRERNGWPDSTNDGNPIANHMGSYSWHGAIGSPMPTT